MLGRIPPFGISRSQRERRHVVVGAGVKGAGPRGQDQDPLQLHGAQRVAGAEVEGEDAPHRRDVDRRTRDETRPAAPKRNARRFGASTIG